MLAPVMTLEKKKALYLYATEPLWHPLISAHNYSGLILPRNTALFSF